MVNTLKETQELWSSSGKRAGGIHQPSNWSMAWSSKLLVNPICYFKLGATTNVIYYILLNMDEYFQQQLLKRHHTVPVRLPQSQKSCSSGNINIKISVCCFKQVLCEVNSKHYCENIIQQLLFWTQNIKSHNPYPVCTGCLWALSFQVTTPNRSINKVLTN